MRFSELVAYSQRIGAVKGRNEKIAIIREFLSQLNDAEAVGVNYIAGKTRQGKLNIAWKGLSELMASSYERSRKTPTLVEVDGTLERVRVARGKQKIAVLAPLFKNLNKQERQYLTILILGEVQQGAGEGLVKTAIARVFDLTDADIEHAYMHTPDIGKLFMYVRKKGKAGIKHIGVRIFKPVRPMLAQIADSVDEIFKEYDDFALEYKLDGVRIQLHKQNDKVKIFSRHLKDITLHFPELVETAQKLNVKECILDGEAIGIDSQGRPLPFQILAKRTTRKKDIEMMRRRIHVVPQFFDVLFCDGDDVTRLPYKERWHALTDIVKKREDLTPRSIPANKATGQKFFARAIEKGSEGVMVKLLTSPYQAGKRGKIWFKIKRTHTIDCVILAAEWGHGRRTGWLSNLHLGVLDETRTKYLMAGKTFKGLTDKMLEWFTEHLQQIKVSEDRWSVYVKPEIVVEVAFNEVQKSTKYDSGIALRFARIKAIRSDKKPEEINTVVDLHMLSDRRVHNEL